MTAGARYRTELSALQAVQKPRRGSSLYSRHVNRPLGRRVAAAAAVLGLSPNTVTLLSAACSFTGVLVVALVHPETWAGVVVALTLAVGFVLDSADGQLARLLGGGSLLGELLDHLVDCGVKLALHGAVLIALYRLGDSGPVLLLPLAFQCVSVLLFFGGTLVGALRERAATHPGRQPSSRLTGLVLLPVDHGVLCLSFLLWGSPHLFLVVYAVLMLATTGALLGLARRWSRELRVARRDAP